MNICKIIYLCWLMLGVGVELAQHDKPKTGHHNFWITLIGVALQLALLTGAGFFE